MRGNIKKRLINWGAIILCVLALVFAALQYSYYLQGRTVFSQAKGVYMTAGVILLQTADANISDADYMIGFTGTYAGNPENSWSVSRLMISQRMNSMLAPDIIFSAKPEQDRANVIFTVENRTVTGMIYQTVKGNRLYVVTYQDGKTEITNKRFE
jgi:hypothetical protein